MRLSIAAQLLNHIKGAVAFCGSNGRAAHVVLLIPDKTHVGAPVFSAAVAPCKQHRVDWVSLLKALKRVTDEAPEYSQGKAFLPAYIDFVEREVLHMWKGFDAGVLAGG